MEGNHPLEFQMPNPLKPQIFLTWGFERVLAYFKIDKWEVIGSLRVFQVVGYNQEKREITKVPINKTLEKWSSIIMGHVTTHDDWVRVFAWTRSLGSDSRHPYWYGHESHSMTHEWTL